MRTTLPHFTLLALVLIATTSHAQQYRETFDYWSVEWRFDAFDDRLDSAIMASESIQEAKVFLSCLDGSIIFSPHRDIPKDIPAKEIGIQARVDDSQPFDIVVSGILNPRIVDHNVSRYLIQKLSEGDQRVAFRVSHTYRGGLFRSDTVITRDSIFSLEGFREALQKFLDVCPFGSPWIN